MSSVLRDLLDLLQNNDLLTEFCFENLKSLSANTDRQIIDLDELKKRFCSELGVSSFKLADVLILHLNQQAITFLEFKDLESLLQHTKLKINNLDNISFLKQKFENFRIQDKILDSFVLILAIGGFFQTNKQFYKEILEKNRIKINFFIVINISSRNYIKYHISKLVNWKFYEFRFLNSFKLIRDENLQEILSIIEKKIS